MKAVNQILVRIFLGDVFLLAGLSKIGAYQGTQMQMIMFMKNIAIAGGLLSLALNGAVPYSLDNRRSGTGLVVSHS